MLIVIDTNILVNALKSRDDNAKSVQLFKDVLNGRHRMCVSSAIMDEYEDVLHRKELGLSVIDVDYILAWIRINSLWIEPKPTTVYEVKMRDEDDRCFFDVARCLRVKLVTRNYKDYPVHELVTLIDELY